MSGLKLLLAEYNMYSNSAGVPQTRESLVNILGLKPMIFEFWNLFHLRIIADIISILYKFISSLLLTKIWSINRNYNHKLILQNVSLILKLYEERWNPKKDDQWTTKYCSKRHGERATHGVLSDEGVPKYLGLTVVLDAASFNIK